MGPLRSGPKGGTGPWGQYKTPNMGGSIRAQRRHARSAFFSRVPLIRSKPDSSEVLSLNMSISTILSKHVYPGFGQKWVEAFLESMGPPPSSAYTIIYTAGFLKAWKMTVCNKGLNLLNGLLSLVQVNRAGQKRSGLPLSSFSPHQAIAPDCLTCP